MEISNQVVKPHIDRMIKEYEDLAREISGHEDEDALELKAMVDKKLAEIETLSRLDSGHPDLRRLKLESRFARRRWMRHLLSEIRTEKNRRKRNYVSTVAA